MLVKTTKRLVRPAIFFIVGLILLPGCGKDGAVEGGVASDLTETDHGHLHGEGPHGGMILVTPDHAAHLEVVHDAGKGEIVFHVLGADMKSALEADTPPLINIKTGGGSAQIASDPAADGGYAAEDTLLMVESLHGQIVLAVGGKAYYIPLHSHGGHEEDHGAADGHGHAHAHGENTISCTAWTERCEWFVELDMPVAGADCAFAAHVTLLDGFAPAASGSFSVEARSGSLRSGTSAGAPARPGIFTPSIRFPEPGEWTLSLVYANGSLEDFIEWKIEVLAEGTHPEEAEEAADLISYLKEQQWKVDFATAWIDRREGPDGSVRLLVPAGSVQSDSKGQAVFVQADGESFRKMTVETGSEEGGLVEIVSGLGGEERIVVRGAELLEGP